jgi:hypothetical protein
MSVAFKHAAEIVHGYTERKCLSCPEMILVPPWFKPHSQYCDTCRAMVIDDFRSLDSESDIEESDDEQVE